MADSLEEHLASRLLAGVAHLQASRLDEAIDALDEVARSPELAAAADLVDVRARALTLLGDALLRAGRHEEAAGHVREAGALLRDAGDPVGSREVQLLLERVVDAQRAADEARLRERSAANLHAMPVDDLRRRFRGLQLADVLIKKANAALDHEDRALAIELAREALTLSVELAGLREEVMARLSLVRAEVSDASDQLLTAWRRAERADEFNLVTAVSRAGEAHGIPLPRQIGPDLPNQRTPSGVSDGDRDEPMG